MYNVISDIIQHTWNSNTYGNEQQYIYYIAGAIICIFFGIMIDLIYRFLNSIINKLR